MEIWLPPAAPEHSAAGAHLGFGSWTVKGIAVNPGEVPVFCALPFLLPLCEGGFLSWCPVWPGTFGHGYYPKALQEFQGARGRLGGVLECQNPWLGCVRSF